MAPPTTTLMALSDGTSYEHEPYLHSQTWRKSFEELFLLLGFIEDADQEDVTVRHFSFQHSRDLSKFKRRSLSITVSSRSLCNFAMDNVRSRVSDSSSGQALVAELEEYANRILSRVRDYSHRLIEKGIIPDTKPFEEVDLLTCPLCHSHLWSCRLCDAAVACSNRDCAGSQVIDCKQCDVHCHMACQTCLDSEQDAIPTFLRCPTCGSWCCRHDMRWCPGGIIQPTLQGNELVEQSGLTSVARTHSPLPSPCRSCVVSGHADAWKMCSERYTPLCPSKAHTLLERGLRGAYCPECITENNGRRCACGTVWLCATCSVADSLHFPSLISCPRCGTTYCTTRKAGCRYCSFCRICRRTGICSGCQAVEKVDPGGENTSNEGSLPLTVFERCAGCHWGVCNECCSTSKGGAVRCSDCGSWTCRDCGKWCAKCRL